jgi:hypothetical protein
MTRHTHADEEWVIDALETVQEMRDNLGELDLQLPLALLPDAQRAIEQDLRDLCMFGYRFQTEYDALGRIIRVRLLEQ